MFESPAGGGRRATAVAAAAAVAKAAGRGGGSCGGVSGGVRDGDGSGGEATVCRARVSPAEPAPGRVNFVRECVQAAVMLGICALTFGIIQCIVCSSRDNFPSRLRTCLVCGWVS